MLEVKNVNHQFGNKKVLYDINFAIRTGSITSICGPSGAGKSTLLHAILGTHPPTTGEIIADNEKIIQVTKKVGIVYQNYSLYEHMTARENVALGLKLDQTSIPSRILKYPVWRNIRKEHLQEADAFLDKLGLAQVAKQYPKELSGGQKQRVAIAQSLIMKPSILLMDEPFGALDESTREALQIMLLNLYQDNIKHKHNGNGPLHTILLVTHELNEALYVSDRVIGLSQYHSEGEKGATIVYDQPSPVFRPNDPKDFTRFAKQKEDIKRVVLSPEKRERSEKLIRIWNNTELQYLPGDENLSRDRI